MTFCSNCGKQLASNKNFCTGCGTKVEKNSHPVQQKVTQNTFSKSNVFANPDSNLPNAGKLLVSGDGKYNLSSLIYWSFLIIGDIALLFFGFRIRDMVARAPRPTFNRTPYIQVGTWTLSIEQAQTLSSVLIFIAIVLIVIGTFFAIWALRRCQSKINVYENVITGTNVQGFSPTLQEFNIPIIDVMNVDVLNQTGVIIRTQYGTYKSYTKKADEIRNIVMLGAGKP